MVSCILNYTKSKQHYIAVGSWDGTVKILNSEYNIQRVIKGGEYAVTSLSTDDEGDFLFIDYKNVTIKVMNLEEEESENETKQTIETGIDINAILFESKFFKYMLLVLAKDSKLAKLKEERNMILKTNKMEIVFLLHMIQAMNIYLLDLLMVL